MIVLYPTTDTKCGYIKFNMNEDTIGGEELVRAELHLLQNNLTELPSHYNMDIFYLLSENATVSPVNKHFKMDSTPGWKKMDVTSLALRLKKGWPPNHGLQIRLTKGKKVIPCKGVFAEEKDFNETHHNQPLLVVFTRDHNSKFLTKILKEVTPMRNHTHTRQQKHNTIDVQHVGCHRKELIVTPDSLNSSGTLLLLPKRLDVGVCEGHCTKLQPAPNNDHAYILSLYYRNNVELSEVPSKCCVPTSYEKVNMLFYNKTNGENIFKIGVAVKAKQCICL